MDIANTIKAIIILQTDGRKMLAKYYDQRLCSIKFERNLFTKTKTPKAKNDIINMDDVLILHRFVIDSHFYVIGGRMENPIILENVLNCLVEVVSTLSANNLSNNTISDNLGSVILALEEICDQGLILEVDPNLVLQRITQSQEDPLESMAQRTARRFLGLYT